MRADNIVKQHIFSYSEWNEERGIDNTHTHVQNVVTLHIVTELCLQSRINAVRFSRLLFYNDVYLLFVSGRVTRAPSYFGRQIGNG